MGGTTGASAEDIMSRDRCTKPHAATLPVVGLLIAGVVACASPGPAPTAEPSGAAADAGGGSEHTSPPVAILSPAFGAATRIVTLAEGPHDSVLVVTAVDRDTLTYSRGWDEISSSDVVLHRVEVDGSVAWSLPLWSELTAARTRVHVARISDDLIAVVDAPQVWLVDGAGNVQSKVPLFEGKTFHGMAPIPKGGIAGVVQQNDSPYGFEAFYWRTDGGPDFLPIDAGGAELPSCQTLTVDEARMIWCAHTALARVDDTGKATVYARTKVGTPTRTVVSRPLGGAFVGLTPVDGKGNDGIAEVDADGDILRVFASAREGHLARATGGDLILTTTRTEHLGRSGAFAHTLVVMDAVSSKELAFPAGDDAVVTSSVAAGEFVWLGGTFSGHLKIGDDEVRSGPGGYRPLLIRITGLTALAGVARGTQCKAHESSCAACVAACEGGCSDVGACLTARSWAEKCACRAPEDFATCYAGTTKGIDGSVTKPVASCFGERCAKACGLGE